MFGLKIFTALAALQLITLTAAAPRPQATTTAASSSSSSSTYWVSSIQRQGAVAFGSSSNYTVFRNVMDFGATGDGSTDDTAAINEAISSGNRCGQGCDSSTVTPAIVYFPPGTYVVSQPIVQYYYTQFIGDAVTLPTIKAAAGFQGIAVIDSDPYESGGANWYTNQNNFFRQIRNFVIDLTAMPMTSGAGIHWQVAQATSLQNIRFEMVQGGGSANQQQGIFMDNGSGGFFSDLVFNGGNYGVFLGNQQFTTRNLTFNGCNTAIYMNWNWAWTFKSLTINNCAVGLNMSTGGFNQTVGSVLVLDSTLTNTPIGIVTSRSSTSVPTTGGTLIIKNVDFTGSQTAVQELGGSTLLAGGSVVASWGQGTTYSSTTSSKLKARQASSSDSCAAPAAAAPAAPAAAASTLAGTVYPVQGSASGVSPSVVSSAAAVAGSQTTTAPAAPAAASETTDTTAAASIAAPSVGTSASANSTATSAGNSTSCTASATPVSQATVQGDITAPSIPGVLMNGNNIFERSKPQYETVPVSSFVSVKSAGAKGDGSTDDTAAIQNVLNNATSDQVVYFDHGAYIITSTVKVPKNIKITGEIWPLIMAKGSFFADQTNPKPVFQVGQPGDSGAVEMSDLIFETAGPAPGAVLMEWNVAESSQGSNGIWDVHFRVGGTAGTSLQSDTCAKNPNVTTTASTVSQCEGAFLMFHMTSTGTGYLENSWAWVADHELDLSDHDQINIFNGRGVLIESQGPVWMYGTASEHSQFYNYEMSSAKNVFMALIQTETAYMQSNPDALNGGFTPNAQYDDPQFASCTDESCKKTWGLRVIDSSDIYMYGGGLYSFFDNYDQDCLATESCQDNMVDVQCSNSVYLYGLSTKASVSMVTLNGQSVIKASDNENNFCQTVALFEQ